MQSVLAIALAPFTRERLTLRRRPWYGRTVVEPRTRADVEEREAAEERQDGALVVAIAGGDRKALARLYHRYAASLMAVAQRILGDRREAEDLLHDVFLEVWRHASHYDAARGTVRAWLLMRMRSRSLDRRKSAGFSRSVPLEERRTEEPAPTRDDPALAPDRSRVRRALAELPDEHRVVLELGYFEGLSSSEIAARLELPVGTVKSRVAAALARLRAGLGES
jgi:RNA polymerase sigma-70 factor (ECF subfamily)